jgi:hypothetical protein
VRVAHDVVRVAHASALHTRRRWRRWAEGREGRVDLT